MAVHPAELVLERGYDAHGVVWKASSDPLQNIEHLQYRVARGLPDVGDDDTAELSAP